jgi:hypothetical protein
MKNALDALLGNDVGLQLLILRTINLAACISLVQKLGPAPSDSSVKFAVCPIGVTPVSDTGEHEEYESQPQHLQPAEITPANS